MASEPEPVGLGAVKPSLLTIPAEIRNHIFALAVVSEAPLPFLNNIRPGIFGEWSQPTEVVALPIPPALARTSRQARNEVVPIFYGANTFVLHIESGPHPRAWRECVTNLNPAIIEHSRKVVLRREYVPSMNGTGCTVDLELTLSSTRDIKMRYRLFEEEHCTCLIEEVTREIIGLLGSDDHDVLFVVAAILGNYQGIVFDIPRYLSKWPVNQSICECGKITKKLHDAKRYRCVVDRMLCECSRPRDLGKLRKLVLLDSLA